MNRTKYILAALLIMISIIFFMSLHYDKIPFFDKVITEYQIKKVKRELSKNPNSLQLQTQFAQLILDQGDWEEPQKKVKQLQTDGINTSIISELLGDRFFKLNEFEKSASLYKEALKTTISRDHLLHFKIANSYLNSERLHEALQEYELQLTLLKYHGDKDKADRLEKFIIKTIDRIKRQILENPA